ncbi:MAG: YcbK family protein [Proteobacteria bacterium]|nr:YcbK family protein [Pseudomonadota bacterium]
MKILELRTSLCGVVALGSMVTIMANLSAESSRDSAQECFSIDSPLEELLSREQTLLTWPVKKPKIFEPAWRAPRNRGLQSVVTTLYSIHSRESVPILKGYPPPGEVLDELFRCRGFGERNRVDPRLVEILVAAAQHFQAPRIEIISAYRSQKFNDALAKKGRRVARDSRHTRGEAIDFSLKTTHATKVGRWLWDTFDGGVGTYPRDNFVHVDVGPKRRWRGK